jgi:hypothetical protein
MENGSCSPALNIDIVRRLAVASDPDAALTLISGLSDKFDGFS